MCPHTTRKFAGAHYTSATSTRAPSICAHDSMAPMSTPPAAALMVLRVCADCVAMGKSFGVCLHTHTRHPQRRTERYSIRPMGRSRCVYVHWGSASVCVRVWRSMTTRADTQRTHTNTPRPTASTSTLVISPCIRISRVRTRSISSSVVYSKHNTASFPPTHRRRRRRLCPRTHMQQVEVEEA
jgi:hypothetical protein